MSRHPHLLPEESSFRLGPLRRAYRDRVYAALLPETDRSVTVATAISLPSFEPEWAIRIHRQPEQAT